MSTYIALLRGINVGGRNALPMKELAALLEELGCENVKTYIQSGNVVLQSAVEAPRMSREIAREINKRHGFEPHVLLLGAGDLEKAISENPFPEAESDPKSLHVGFLDSVPKEADLEKLEELRAESERFQLKGLFFYLHAPDGVGRSKLAARSEKWIGVSMTSRNWRTVCKIAAMLEAVE